MQHRICRSPQSRNHRNRIFQSLPRKNIPRPNPFSRQSHDRFACLPRIHLFVWRNRRHRRAIRQTQSHRLNRTSHRVSRVHSTTRTRSRNRTTLNLPQLRLTNRTLRPLPHRFKDTNNIQLLFPDTPRQNRSPVNKDRRPIQPQHRHDTTRHVLIAPAERHQPIKSLTPRHRLNRVRNHLS